STCTSCSTIPPSRALHSFPTRRSSDLFVLGILDAVAVVVVKLVAVHTARRLDLEVVGLGVAGREGVAGRDPDLVLAAGVRRVEEDRKSTRLNSSHRTISYAVFCLKKKS